MSVTPEIVCRSCEAVLAENPDIETYQWRPCTRCGSREQSYRVQIGGVEMAVDKIVADTEAGGR